MRKLNFLILIFTALLVSGSVWGGNFERPLSKPIGVTLSQAEKNFQKSFNRVLPRKATLSDDDIAQVGDLYFKTLEEAIDAYAGENPVVLLKNITIKGGISISKSVKIDLGGNTITAECGWMFNIYGGASVNVEFSNGSLVGTSTTYGFYGQGGSSLTVTNINVSGVDYAFYADWESPGCNFTINGGKYSGSEYAICSYGGNITIENGELFGGSYCIYFWKYTSIANTKIEVKDGIFKCGSYGNLLFSITGDVEVKGGKFYTPEGSVNFTHYYPSWYYGTFKVTGGWYDNTTDLGVNLPDGYSFGKPKDGLYPLIKAVAQTGDYGFPSVTEAIYEAENGDVISLIDNSNSEDVICNKDITLDLGVYALKSLKANNATIKVYGLTSSSIGTLAVENQGNLVLYGGTYTTDPTDLGYLAEGYSIIPGTTYTVGRKVAKLGDNTFYTLQAAVKSAGTDSSTIVIIADNTPEGTVKIDWNQNITIELAGHEVSGCAYASSSYALITNHGNLTIQDSTDIEKNGSGEGKLTTIAYAPDRSNVPGYATSTILNYGKLIVKSGFIESGSLGSASYAIDVDAENAIGGGHYPTYSIDNTGYGDNKRVELYILGGKVKAGQSMSIRQYLDNGEGVDCIVSISGGVVYRLWVQDNGAATKGSLSIKNALFPEGIKVGYDGLSENFALDIDSTTFYGYFNYGFDHTKAGNTLSITNSALGSFYTQHPTPMFEEEDNNIYNFEDDVETKLISEDDTTAWCSVEGQYVLPIKGSTYWYMGFVTASRSLHIFYDYVKPGNGLVSIVKEGFNNPYILKKQNETTGSIDVPGHDGELGNPWHQDKTWDLTKTDVVPKDTNAVLIDHDVFVEGFKDVPEGQEPEKADAGSIVIEPAKTLTVRSGATLNIGNAGIIIKKDTLAGIERVGQLIIEPEALVTVGANGVIADTVENIIIKTSEAEQGIFMVAPEVTMNTQPQATVELYTTARKGKWQRFASPLQYGTYGDNVTNNNQTANQGKPVTVVGGGTFGTSINEWNYIEDKWRAITKTTPLSPFLGYALSNNSIEGGVTYTFTGQIMGNVADDMSFVGNSYNLFGNSYTAPIDIFQLIKTVKKEAKSVASSIYLWSVENQGYIPENFSTIETEMSEYEEIPSLHTFIMLNTGEDASTILDYEAAVWNPIMNPSANLSAPVRKINNGDNMMRIRISSENGHADDIVLMESDNFTEDFEDGADTEKYFNSGNVNIYTSKEDKKLSIVASDLIEGTSLSIQTVGDLNYTISFEKVIGSDYALFDKVTNTTMSIVTGEQYTFTAQPNATVEDRFQIVESRKMPTNTEVISANVSSKGIYTVVGQYIGETSMWNTLPYGVYIVNGVKIVK